MTDKQREEIETIGMSRDDLSGCPFCGAKPVNCGGYDFGKIACYGSFCPISGVPMPVEKWQAAQQPAQAEPVLVMTARELWNAIHFVNPDWPDDESQMDDEVAITIQDGELVCCMAEEPEEGGIPLSTPQPPKAVPDGLRETIVQEIQNAWDDFTGDTGCIPPDFELRGPRTASLSFSAGQWAEMVGEWVEERLAKEARKQ